MVNIAKRLSAVIDSVEALVHRALASRKFMATAAAVSAALHAGRPDLAVGAVVAYILAEAHVDASNKK